MCPRVSPYCDVLIENECEYLNWTLAGLLSPRASRDWTQGLLTHETPSLYHLLFKISAALEYVFTAAMILYNLVTSCQPWTFIHPLNCYEQFKIIPGGSSGQILAGKTSWRSILNHSSIILSSLSTRGRVSCIFYQYLTYSRSSWGRIDCRRLRRLMASKLV